MRKLGLIACLLASACSAGRDNSQMPPPGNPASTFPELTPDTWEVVETSIMETSTTIEETVEILEVVTSTSPRAKSTTTVYIPPTPPPTRARSTSSELAAIRECESGGDYTTDTGNGYYGAYQFDQDTWEAAGGSGNPADASPAEQDMRAQSWINQGNRSAWPNC